MNGFEKIIQTIPKGSRILDVGSGGHEGENTTNYLIKRFGVDDVLGINIRPEKAEEIIEAHKGFNVLVGDFYKHKFKEKFDAVILDMNIENNVIYDWSLEGLERVRGLLNKGGMLVNYIMTTDQYGDPNETPKLIRKMFKEFWKVEKLDYEAIGNRLQDISGYEVFAQEQEERRPYILWVALQKIE